MSDLHEPEGESHRFLTSERIERVGELIEPLLRDGLSWIERRKESVSILDDTALRRQISVDFTLRSTTPALVEASGPGDEAIYCAPVFALPKAPSNLMAFDLEDESGRSLRVVSRSDNAHISGKALRRMAARVLGREPDGALGDELELIARADADEGEQRALRLEQQPTQEYAAEAAKLLKDDRFRWLLLTFAHSSILVVLFRSASPRRKLIKLTFEQPIESELRTRASLGWDPYRVWVDSPLVEARTYHFEAEAPPGLRITEARLSDDGHPDPVVDDGFLRRIHLYRDDASRAGAGTAMMWLRVSSNFAGGALTAALLTFLALTACSVFAEKIATNPSSAPALLLFLPGFIATYIARPDQHALTTRLLSTARTLLMGVAFIAYVAAARVVLSGGAAHGTTAVADATDGLRWWLIPLAFLAFCLMVALSITYARGRRPAGNRKAAHFAESAFVAMARAQVHTFVEAGSLLPDGYELADHDIEEILFIRSAWHGDSTLAVRAAAAKEHDGSEQRDGCWVRVQGAYSSRSLGLLARARARKDRAAARRFLEAIQGWATGTPGET
jgi:hypothetical protein